MSSLYYFIIASILLTDIIMNKKLVGDEARKLSEATNYKWFILISIIIMIPFLVSTWILDLNQPQPLPALLLGLCFCYKAFMEFRYIKETKRHLVSLTAVGILLGFAGLLLILGII